MRFATALKTPSQPISVRAAGTGTFGTCSPVCSPSTQTCIGTECLLNNGQACSIAAQCASATCTPFYVDLDSDGYGAGQATGFCGSTAPIGNAAQNGDCCDTATNIAVAKLIHPGADFQTISAGGVCNITWDYDCSGAVETFRPMLICGPAPSCIGKEVDLPESACGTLENQTCSCTGAGGICTVACSGHPSVAITCK